MHSIDHVHLRVRDLGRSIEFVDDGGSLADIHDRLRESGVRVSPVDHGISLALSFDDPDGNGLEACVDTREKRDREERQGQNEPFDPAAVRRSERRHFRRTGPRHYRGGRRMSDVLYSVPPTRRQ